MLHVTTNNMSNVQHMNNIVTPYSYRDTGSLHLTRDHTV